VFLFSTDGGKGHGYFDSFDESGVLSYSGEGRYFEDAPTTHSTNQHAHVIICCISLYFAQLSRILPRDELVPVPRYSGRGQLRCRAARRQIMTHGRSAIAKQSFCAAADATQSHQGRLR